MSQQNQLKIRESCGPMDSVGPPAPRRILRSAPAETNPPPPRSPFCSQLFAPPPCFSNSKLGRSAHFTSRTKQTTSLFSNSKLLAFLGVLFFPARAALEDPPTPRPSRHSPPAAGRIEKRPSVASLLAVEFLPATSPQVGFELTACNQTTSLSSSSNKFGLSESTASFDPLCYTPAGVASNGRPK